MAINYYSSINLNKNELQAAVIGNLGSAPGSPAEGQMYYDTGDNTIYFRDDSGWVDVGSSGDITGVTAGVGLSGGGSSGGGGSTGDGVRSRRASRHHCYQHATQTEDISAAARECAHIDPYYHIGSGTAYTTCVERQRERERTKEEKES